MPPKRTPVVSPLTLIKEIDQDPKVVELVSKNLPPNYDFEIGKTIWRIRKTAGCKTVALQFPEGLLIFSTKIGDILRTLTGVDIILLGDITYGACCVDDFTASMLGADLLVHYGHSCLVPTSVANRIETIYIFVTIQYNLDTAVNCIANLVEQKKNEKKIAVEGSPFNLSVVSTIQFANSLIPLKNKLVDKISDLNVNIPRSKPLSNGEILGCTAPKVSDNLIVYVGDGRFHLEAMMMANPTIQAYRFDPYNSTLTHETFDHDTLSKTRKSSTMEFKKHKRIGIILGTLGRQGNNTPMDHVYKSLLDKDYAPFTVLMSEVMPAKLALFKTVDGWVQFACPRLSIDWGNAFSKPILTPYEAMHCLSSETEYNGHPMDYYAYDSLGAHTPNHVPPK